RRATPGAPPPPRRTWDLGQVHPRAVAVGHRVQEEPVLPQPPRDERRRHHALVELLLRPRLRVEQERPRRWAWTNRRTSSEPRTAASTGSWSWPIRRASSTAAHTAVAEASPIPGAS